MNKFQASFCFKKLNLTKKLVSLGHLENLVQNFMLPNPMLQFQQCVDRSVSESVFFHICRFRKYLLLLLSAINDCNKQAGRRMISDDRRQWTLAKAT